MKRADNSAITNYPPQNAARAFLDGPDDFNSFDQFDGRDASEGCRMRTSESESVIGPYNQQNCFNRSDINMSDQQRADTSDFEINPFDQHRHRTNEPAFNPFDQHRLRSSESDINQSLIDQYDRRDEPEFNPFDQSGLRRGDYELNTFDRR